MIKSFFKLILTLFLLIPSFTARADNKNLPFRIAEENTNFLEILDRQGVVIANGDTITFGSSDFGTIDALGMTTPNGSGISASGIDSVFEVDLGNFINNNIPFENRKGALYVIGGNTGYAFSIRANIPSEGELSVIATVESVTGNPPSIIISKGTRAWQTGQLYNEDSVELAPLSSVTIRGTGSPINTDPMHNLEVQDLDLAAFTRINDPIGNWSAVIKFELVP